MCRSDKYRKIFSRVLAVLIIFTTKIALAAEEVAPAQKSLPHTSAEQMIKMVIGLLFVLLLIFFLAWLIKKYLGFGIASNAAIKTIAGIAVGQKERVLVVQVGERQFVIGVAPGQVSMLHAIERGEEVFIPEQAVRNAFAEKLKNSISILEKK